MWNLSHRPFWQLVKIHDDSPALSVLGGGQTGPIPAKIHCGKLRHMFDFRKMVTSDFQSDFTGDSPT